jgi:triphosphoribosyl-dephospho-CoA synthase
MRVEADVYEIVAAAQLACLLEAAAPKPGNISPGRSFGDSTYEDYVASAAAIGAPLAGVGTRPVGATVRLAVEATARWTRSNTNLGIVLLLVPLARAAVENGVGILFSAELPAKTGQTAGVAATKENDVGILFRAATQRVLEATTVEDAREVYAAIRRAAPGGLGRVDAQDVADEPTQTLLDVMRLAAARDGVAREYVTGFEVTFETAVPALSAARADGLCWNDAIVETFLTLLAAHPDTHIARRAGTALAADVSRRARDVIAAGGVRSEPGRRAIDDMDRALRDPRHAANPGTTADLTAAAIFVSLLQRRPGGINEAW